jgi:hypothetical protein
MCSNSVSLSTFTHWHQPTLCCSGSSSVTSNTFVKRSYCTVLQLHMHLSWVVHDVTRTYMTNTRVLRATTHTAPSPSEFCCKQPSHYPSFHAKRLALHGLQADGPPSEFCCRQPSPYPSFRGKRLALHGVTSDGASACL